MSWTGSLRTLAVLSHSKPSKLNTPVNYPEHSHLSVVQSQQLDGTVYFYFCLKKSVFLMLSITSFPFKRINASQILTNF